MSRKRKDLFANELPTMMYGFGDVPPEEQDPQTVEVVEDLLCEYLRFIAWEAAEVSDGVKISLDDMMFVLRKDKRKHDRVRELIAQQKLLEKSRQAFKEPTLK